MCFFRLLRVEKVLLGQLAHLYGRSGTFLIMKPWLPSPGIETLFGGSSALLTVAGTVAALTCVC